MLLRGKANIGRDPGALEFRVVGRKYRHDDGRVTEREVVVDVGPSDVTMADLHPDRMIGAREPTKTDKATEYIQDALRGGEWRTALPIIEALKSQGLGGDSVVKHACLAPASRRKRSTRRTAGGGGASRGPKRNRGTGHRHGDRPAPHRRPARRALAGPEVARLPADARGPIPAVKLGRYYRYRLDAIERFELGDGATCRPPRGGVGWPRQRSGPAALERPGPGPRR